ncbi:MAG: sigma-70 family RNA polymerase sigma factor [Alphaproteobacteria bacterium]
MADIRHDIAAELPRLRRYARALLRDGQAADDLVQDCLERALSRTHQFRAGTNLRAWLFTIMHGIHVNALRRQNRATDTTPLEPGMENRNPSPPAQVDSLAMRDLAGALDQLPIDQRAVVLLIGLEGMSYREAAGILEVPQGTVMSRLARGRERLRQLMEGEEAHPLVQVK